MLLIIFPYLCDNQHVQIAAIYSGQSSGYFAQFRVQNVLIHCYVVIVITFLYCSHKVLQ